MNPTASELPRALRCPASCVLPHSEEPETEHAGRGTALHSALEGDLESVPEEHAAEAAQLVDAMARFTLPEDVQHEVAFAYDVVTGKGRLLDVTNREYAKAELGPHEHSGTADLWAPGWVADGKSGHRDVDPPAENAQLLLAGAANASIYGRDAVTLEVFDIRDPSNPKPYGAEVDTFDLEDFRGRLMALHSELARLRESKKSLPVVEGDHCRYCPALWSCPAKQTMLARINDGDLAREVNVSWAGGLTPQSAPTAVRQLKMLGQVYARATAILKAYAKENPIDLGDGMVYGPRLKSKEYVDGAVTWAVLKEKYGPDVAEKAVGFTASKTAIKDAIRTVAARGKIKATTDDVLAEIRDRGGTQRKESIVVEEHRPKERV